jgi:thioredoxin 1
MFVSLSLVYPNEQTIVKKLADVNFEFFPTIEEEIRLSHGRTVMKMNVFVVYFTNEMDFGYYYRFRRRRVFIVAIVNVSDQSFKNEVEAQGTVLVDFWAPWCGPCKMIAPVLEELNTEVDGLKIAKVNVDDNPESASRFGVMSIPTLIVFKNGEPVDKVIGFQSKDALKNVVNRHLS